MPSPLQSSFDVKVGADTYTFKMPTIRFEIENAYRANDIRRRAYPTEGGGLAGVDFQAALFSRYCAYLELYLTKATTLWPFGYASDDDMSAVDFSKVPAVDFEKFPAECVNTIFEVGEAFEKEIMRFRRPRNPSNGPDSEKTVAGQ